MFTFAPHARLFSFPVFFDGGCAPFVRDGLASFALTQPQVRAQAQVDDVLLGLAGEDGRVRMVFALVVDAVLPWMDYSAQCRTGERRRVPRNILDAADAIFPPQGRNPLPSWSGHIAADFARDVEEGKHALTSRRFWYFGQGERIAAWLPDDLQTLLPSAGFRQWANAPLMPRFAAFFNELLTAHGAQECGSYGQPREQPVLEGFDFIMSCSTLSASADGCGAQVEGRVPLDVLRDAERANDAMGEAL